MVYPHIRCWSIWPILSVKNPKEQLLAGIRTLTRHAHGRDMKEMEHLSHFVVSRYFYPIDDGRNKSRPSGKTQRLSQILDEESTQIAFDEVLTKVVSWI